MPNEYQMSVERTVTVADVLRVLSSLPSNTRVYSLVPESSGRPVRKLHGSVYQLDSIVEFMMNDERFGVKTPCVFFVESGTSFRVYPDDVEPDDDYDDDEQYDDD